MCSCRVVRYGGPICGTGARSAIYVPVLEASMYSSKAIAMLMPSSATRRRRVTVCSLTLRMYACSSGSTYMSICSDGDVAHLGKVS